ncbi:MAG: type IV-A pilus assembly ATPase PilB [Pseudomonadales bacterium]|jgi:type IV pilus assembly protein PilB|nr:type IV-A pilus assembly ATPase PilB [Pseudomonadales bacterium]MDP6470894.1 type IV-A pilus assembly ATPase PilB [Pseudomonadales bacterium]MDP6825921.1 type IV-A pilus assembly ATPase PilB [Pseudomonadales bacterium]MDP6972233.1 type IV-A pilus assembly ATPase PilB [Pseudomonadales bacterium]|tara:strand:- start:3343 stop:5064 length:1722 start_codon:yes stop_codon:yes gene_type:complete
MASEPIAKSGLARRLVDEGVLDAESARRANEEARKKGILFVTYLVQHGDVDAHAIAKSASEEFGVPVIDLGAFDLDSIPVDLVDNTRVRKHNALPLARRGARLFVAVSDPTNLQALDEIKFQTGLNTEPVLVEEDKLDAIIDQFLHTQEDDGLGELESDEFADLDMEAFDASKEEEDEAKAAHDTPIVRFVNKMLLDAIKTGASDIHFEPYEHSYRVRFRTDGILREISAPPQNLGTRLAARLKVMAELDISERRVPQDGRIKMKLSKKNAIDFRVNTLPTLWGEKIVLRILDPSNAQMDIETLGYEEDQRDLYMEALHRHQGMILVTGPTGSGKTVSMYTGLNILNTDERNIATAEDPVEINIEGINQVHVNYKVGLDFASALRAFLRQDPDVVMVGEIRDLETAEIAIKAAQTGHMVLSTLHTNSASETLTRMRNMGVPAFNLATSVDLIIAQRLVRRLCSNCKIIADVPREALLAEGFTEKQVDARFNVFEASDKGCEKCNSGYKGRVGIYEVVKITPKMSRIIMEEGNSLDLAKAAQEEGFNNLRQSGLIKVIQGVTSLAEANRMTISH